MKVFYNGSAEGPVTAFGTVFKDGEAADVDDRFAKKIAGNPYFSTERGGKAKPEKDEAGPKFKAKHIAGGRFSIFRDGVEVMDKLSKADADAFNAFTDAEKVEYLNKAD